MSNRIILLAALLLSTSALAETAWVTDQFEITLRSGPSTSNAIQLMVSSGTPLEVLERDAESGYTRVRTQGGTEGWVLTRYLMNEASAREQLERLTGQLTNANSRGSSLDSQLRAIRGEYDAANRRIQELEREKASVESELAEIKRTAADVLSINEQNKTLMEQLTTAQIRADTLEQENRALGSQTTRYWFMAGALVMLIGILLGIWLPRIRWQRRSRYDRF
jgi:SH3 domain protein